MATNAKPKYKFTDVVVYEGPRKELFFTGCTEPINFVRGEETEVPSGITEHLLHNLKDVKVVSTSDGWQEERPVQQRFRVVRRDPDYAPYAAQMEKDKAKLNDEVTQRGLDAIAAKGNLGNLAKK